MTYTVINGVVCRPANRVVEILAKSRYIKNDTPRQEFPLIPNDKGDKRFNKRA